jgi:hypothetical protein
MQIEHRTTVQAKPEVIFAFYEDVASWPAWDPDTKAATLDGPMRVGAIGRLTPTKGNTVPMLVTEFTAGRSLTVESKIPLFRMVFEHVLNPVPNGTEVIHRVTFTGFLSFLLGSMLSKQLNVGLPVTLAKLKQKAEEKSAA